MTFTCCIKRCPNMRMLKSLRKLVRRLSPPFHILNVMNVNILQWNCQSLRKKRPELEMRSKDYDLILLSETWLNPEDRWLLRNFDVIRSDRDARRGGGVAIMIRNGIKYQIIYNLYNANKKLEICGIKTVLNSKNIAIVSVYRPPQVSLSSQKWRLFLSQFQYDFLLGGDLNAHNIVWGSSYSCPEGKKILDLCMDLNFTILNDGSVTRFATTHSQGSSIDLSITNSPLRIGRLSGNYGAVITSS